MKALIRWLVMSLAIVWMTTLTEIALVAFARVWPSGWLDAAEWRHEFVSFTRMGHD
jgi:hypothetical protein